jgi:long-chain fatty acid transport protein
MRRTRDVVLAAVLAAAMLPAAARGAGYGIYEQGPKGMGMAGAATASIDDPSALWFNPARITRLEGLQIQAGANLLTPTTSFAGVNPYPGFGVQEEMKTKPFTPFSAYLTRRFEGPWAVGVGVMTPFGLGVEWQDPDEFTGRYIVTRADLQTVNGTLCVAWQATPNLSVAGGGNMLYTNVELNRRTLVSAPGGGGGQVDVADVHLQSDWKGAYGYNLALAWTPDPKLDIGFGYRSKIVQDTEGDAEFDQILTGNASFDAAVAASLPSDQGVSTVLRFPAIWQVGAALHPNEDWTLEGDIVVTEWSVFEDLPLRFDDPSINTTIVEEYNDTIAFRFGAENEVDDDWAYRFGYYFEQQAAPSASVSPLLPDSERHGVTLGLSFAFPWLGADRIDLYNLALFTPNVSTEGENRDGFDGEYKSFVNVFGLALTWR